VFAFCFFEAYFPGHFGDIKISSSFVFVFLWPFFPTQMQSKALQKDAQYTFFVLMFCAK
jgi:hypothetical protein